MIITLCYNVMPCNLVEMRNVAVHFYRKTRRHILYGGKFHSYHNANLKSQAVLVKHNRQLECLFCSSKKIVIQGTFCTSYLMPRAMIFFSICLHVLCLELPWQNFQFPYWIWTQWLKWFFRQTFSPHTHPSAWEGCGQGIGSSNARVRSASKSRIYW